MERRYLSPNQIAQQQAGGEYVAPGIWIDVDGNAHFSVPEILAFFDVADTPENREAVVAMLATQLQGDGGVGIIQETRPQ
jgi:hypothetical protein